MIEVDNILKSGSLELDTSLKYKVADLSLADWGRRDTIGFDESYGE